MPQIESADEARQVAQLITSGQLTGAAKDNAMAALRAFDSTAPSAPKPTPQSEDNLARAPRMLAEPVLRAAEGFEQIGAGASDYVAKGITGKDPGMYGRVTKDIDARRKAYNAAHPYDSSTVNDVAAGLVPVGGAIAEATPATTFLRSLLRRMTAGGAIAGTQYVPEGGSRAENVAVGAGGAGILHTLTGAIPGIKNVVSRAITKAEGNPRVASAVNDAKDFFTGSAAVPEPAPYNIGQASGSPALGRLEGRAYGTQQQELHAVQADQARTQFSALADQAANAGKIAPTSQNVANAVNDTLKSTTLGMRTARTTAFNAGMSDVAALAGPGGGPGLVPLTNLTNAYESIIAEDANAFNVHGTTLPSGVSDALKALRATPVGTRIKVPTIQYILKGLGQDAPHGAGVFLSTADARLEMYRGRLKDALNADIDSAGLKPGANVAFDKLQDVRKTYAQQSQALRTVEDGTLNRLFGDPQSLATPGAALDKFYSMRPADQQAAVDLLQRNKPQVLDAMRAHRINTAVTDATTAGAAKNSTFDLKTFNESMFGGDAANSPLWGSDAVSAKMRAGAAHLKVLLNVAPGGPGSVIGPEDVAINLVSQSPQFIARIVTRAVYGSQGDKLLGTPEGLAALRTLSNVSSRKSAAFAQALAYINGLGQQPSTGAPAQ